jgi:hypothetical protein
MSTRKQTVDQQSRRQTDLKLHRRSADDQEER